MTERFTVHKGKVKTTLETLSNRWFILNEGKPFFIANEWIENKTIRNENTGKKYVGNLCRYLNYLDTLKKDYKYATVKDVNNFISHLIYRITDDLRLASIDSSYTYSTLMGYISCIRGFYKALLDGSDTAILERKKSNPHAPETYFYGIIDSDYEVLLESKINALKYSKDYIKWYTPEEVSAIMSNFLTLRDKAIFLLTLDGGMRIDEAISVQLFDYIRDKCTLKPYRSKGKVDGEGRPIVLRESTCEVIDNYMWNERNITESQCGVYTDSLFINLRKGQAQGLEVNPRAWLTTLKNASKRAGLCSDKIRTHSGRSSKTMELLLFQVEHPEENLTDEMIRQWMGWKDPKSLDSYRNFNDIRLAKKRAEKINGKKVKE